MADFSIMDLIGSFGDTPFGQPSNSGVMDARSGMMNWLQSAPTPPSMPPQVNPAFRTEDLLKGGLGALIAGLIGGNQGLDAFGQGYLGGKMKKAESDTQQAQQKWQLGNQQSQQDYQQKGKMAQFQLQNAEQDYNDALKRAEDVVKAKELDIRNQKADFNTAMQGYQNANSEGEKQFWASRMQRLDPMNAPTPEMVKADIDQLKAARVNNALTRWNTMTRNWTNDYGELTDENKAKNDAVAIAKEYGIDPAALPLPPTGATLKKQMQEEKIKEMIAKGVREDDKAAAQIAKGQAETEYKLKKLEMDSQRYLQTGNTAAYNANTRRMEAEAKQGKDAVNGIAQRQIVSLSAKIEGLRAKQKNEQSVSKRQDLQKQIDSFDAQRKFYEGMMDKTPGITKEPSVGTSQFTTPSGNKYSFDR